MQQGDFVVRLRSKCKRRCQNAICSNPTVLIVMQLKYQAPTRSRPKISLNVRVPNVAESKNYGFRLYRVFHFSQASRIFFASEMGLLLKQKSNGISSQLKAQCFPRGFCPASKISEKVIPLLGQLLSSHCHRLHRHCSDLRPSFVQQLSMSSDKLRNAESPWPSTSSETRLAESSLHLNTSPGRVALAAVANSISQRSLKKKFQTTLRKNSHRSDTLSPPC